jgi:hypothetical protein
MGCVVHAAMYADPADLPTPHQRSVPVALLSQTCARVYVGGGADSTKEWWEHWQGARRANHLNLYDVLFVMCVMCAQLKEDVLQRAATA